MAQKVFLIDWLITPHTKNTILYLILINFLITKSQTTSCKTLEEKCIQYINTQNYDSANVTADKLLVEAEKIKSNHFTVAAYNYKGAVLSALNNYKELRFN